MTAPKRPFLALVLLATVSVSLLPIPTFACEVVTFEGSNGARYTLTRPSARMRLLPGWPGLRLRGAARGPPQDAAVQRPRDQLQLPRPGRRRSRNAASFRVLYREQELAI